MLDFFSSVINFLEIAFNVVLNAIKSLVTLIEVLITSFTLPAYVGAFLPVILATSMSIVIGIAVVKLVVGR